MISDKINKEIAQAIKKQDRLRVSVLRMLSSALNYKRIEKQEDLSGEDEMAVVKAEAKKRKDAIEIYEKVKDKENVEEKLERERSELVILKEYLPKELPESEIVKLVESAISESKAKGMSDMGKVIGIVMGKTKGAADGAKVAEIAKSKLG
jgi:uncharacterized protein YqeY